MPNSANRNNNKSNSGKGHAEDMHSGSSQKPNPERSDIKHDTDHPSNRKGDTNRTSNQGRKEASGGEVED